MHYSLLVHHHVLERVLSPATHYLEIVGFWVMTVSFLSVEPFGLLIRTTLRGESVTVSDTGVVSLTLEDITRGECGVPSFSRTGFLVIGPLRGISKASLIGRKGTSTELTRIVVGKAVEIGLLEDTLTLGLILRAFGTFWGCVCIGLTLLKVGCL